LSRGPCHARSRVSYVPRCMELLLPVVAIVLDLPLARTRWPAAASHRVARVDAHARAFNAAPPALWRHWPPCRPAQVPLLARSDRPACARRRRGRHRPVRAHGRGSLARLVHRCRAADDAGPARPRALASAMACRCACMRRAAQTCRESTSMSNPSDTQGPVHVCSARHAHLIFPTMEVAMQDGSSKSL
jgi:hypothetical protein